MAYEQQEGGGRVYVREEDEIQTSVTFNRSPSLLGVINIAHLEFPGVRFEKLNVRATQEGKVSLFQKREK